MIKHDIKFLIRNLLRNRTFSILNILGLTLGLAATIIIFQYVHHQKSYDGFHVDANRIYRINFSFKNGDSYTKTTTSAYRIAPLLKSNIPAIDTTFRMYYAFNAKNNLIYNEQVHDITDNFTYADPNFFSFFSYKLISGNPATALLDPNSLVLTLSQAKKIFGDEEPLGKSIVLRSVYDDKRSQYKVTGVMEDIPDNTHVPYEIFMSLNTLSNSIPEMVTSWGWTSQNTYIKIKPESSISDVESQFKPVISSNAPEWFKEWGFISAQSIRDIHLGEDIKEELKAGGNETYINMLSYIAVFILVIAGINYMNLATSMAGRRYKEVGIKKAIGAKRKDLVIQFLLESLAMLFLSVIFALTVIQLLLPYFAEIIGVRLSILDLPMKVLLIGFLSIFLFGVLSGLYPALFLSSFNSLRAISGNQYKYGRNTIVFRKGLVIVQFMISSFLICATLVILNQWNFLRNRSLGMNTDQVVAIALSSQKAMKNYELLKETLLKYPEISHIGTSSKSPAGRYDGFRTLTFQGDDYTFPIEFLDTDFFQLMDIELLAGRFFSDSPADSNAVILNKTAADKLGIEKVVGGIIRGQADYNIIGIVEDFHFEPLYTRLGPLFIARPSGGSNYAYIKYSIDNSVAVTSLIQQVWQEVNKDQPLNYSFVNKELQQAYQTEQQFFWIFIIFSGFAIFIACLGLFGLVSFSVTQKVKEIGIRKTLGASSQSIIYLLSGSFLKLIIIACFISWPIIWYSMNLWLEKFPYRIDINFLILSLGTILLISLSLMVIVGQTFKASRLNPVKSLRYE